MAWKCPVKGCEQTNERRVDLTRHVLFKLGPPHENWRRRNVDPVKKALLKGEKTLKEVAKELEEKFEEI